MLKGLACAPITSVSQQYDIILLGGLAGRLDQTIHTLSSLHKLRKTRSRVFAVTDENAGWVLDSVSIPVGHFPFQTAINILSGGAYSSYRPQFIRANMWSSACWHRLYDAVNYGPSLELG